jgi:hypothetical protein
MGRELPPAEVLAADQRITAWARQLRAAGLDGSMDLRARAYLDILLGKDSRPSQPTADSQDRPGEIAAGRPFSAISSTTPYEAGSHGRAERRLPSRRCTSFSTLLL